MEPGMTHRRVRIGILGCAKIARRSMAPALLQLADRFELVAAASRDADKAASFAAEFGCQAVTGYAALLARDDIDALYVPLPTGLHAQWVGQALAAGKHVYVEKSFAASADEATQLVRQAADGQLAAMEGYMFLHHRQQQVVAQWLQAGDIGELRHFHGCFGFPPLPAGDFRYDAVLGGGALLDAAGYPLRAAHLFLGHDLQVRAASLRPVPGQGASVWGSAYLSDGAGVGASISFGFDHFYQCRFELWGSRGKLVAERAYTAGPGFSPRLTLETADGMRELLVEPHNHFVAAMNAFADAITDPALRARQHQDILVQSRALQQISDLASRP
jgi:predicted dehydrogenase